MSKRETSPSRTSLSSHAGALRLSLLVSLGLLSQACGGSALTASGGGSGGADPQGGASPGGGGATNGGASPGGGGATNGGASPGGSGAANGGATSGTRECQSPTVDALTGLVKCANGFSHRAQAVKCAAPVEATGGAGPDEPPSDAGSGGFQSCTTDAECSALRFGYCSRGFGAPSQCEAGCQEDSDCGSGVCICDGKTPGRCQPSDCRVDTDCTANSWCASASQVCGEPAFQCTGGADECLTNADCSGSACVIQQGRRVCSGAVCGRPFLVAELPRLADVTERGDWVDLSITPDCSRLSALERAELAAHWSRLGQMEHASIAAFARFNLQLLSLGAPAQLVEACNRALADETAHARICFAFASQYGGTRVGPGKLEIADCFQDSSLMAVMKLVLSEGCIGETVAALEALEAAELATDPSVEQALRRIAQDERAHAALAFQFMTWALEQSTPEARGELVLEAEQRLLDFEQAAVQRASAPGNAALAAHGVVDGARLREVHLRAAREVVRPLLDAVLGGSESTLRA